jgi:transposase
MGKTLNGSLLLPHPASLSLEKVRQTKHAWELNAAADSESATCPDCGVLSTARHSSYLRRLRDLPVQGHKVQLQVRVGRWRCRNANCARKIFCQRINDVAHKQARETKRFGDIIHLLAHALGGRPGERLSTQLGLPVSDDTLLRRVKRWAKFHSGRKPIQVLGVDDWAWRKGYGSYGTILVDLKRRKVVDLLSECSAVSFEQWLRQHAGVKIISRDRQGLLAEGGRRGAPAAEQVADRFHLIQNLKQAVQEELAHTRRQLMIPAKELLRQNGPEKVRVVAESKPRKARSTLSRKQVWQQRRQQKVELFQMVKSLRAQGLKVNDIIRQTGISHGRVYKWLRLEACPLQNKMAPRPGMAEDFREQLWRLWQQGRHGGMNLFAEIRKSGYIGSYGSLMRFLEPWREQRGTASRSSRPAEPIHPGAMRHISPRAAVVLMSKPKPQLNAKQSEIVEFLKRRCPGFATMRHLVLSFRSIVCGGKASSLKRWAEKAEAAGLGAIRRFVRQLKRDWAAAENAVKQVWSNGPVEGHINRLKTLKRQMYGRAKFELLRARTLPLEA